MLRKKWIWIAAIGLVTAAAAYAQGEHAEHASAETMVLPVLTALAVILVAAKLGADIFARIGQPPVLGELVVGVVLGNLTLVGLNNFNYIVENQIIEILAEIGVILLLFQVGLESKVDEMLSVGLSSLLVATIGVVAPFTLGWGIALIFLPDASIYVHMFIGATLCATSVGITARVFKDLGKVHLKEAKIVLGAAVIDDVQGLIILAVVSGIIVAANSGLELSALGISMILIKAVVFLVGSIILGQFLAPRVFGIASALRARGILLAVSLAFCFLMSWIAGRIELAPIVGAFTAGLLLEEVHYKDLLRQGEAKLNDLIEPIAAFLVPVFFVHMGMKVHLTSFANVKVLGFAAALTAVAIIGKQFCSFGVIGRGIDRLTVGLGMIPRGEVGLIFAGIGTTMVINKLPVVSPDTYSAIVVMVIVTTLITPPLLRWSLGRISDEG
ncbi:MAG TPA: cation:proton antiporter, partial [Armatimonadota bacterium]|nr:cation:proton antiporter [Armatimonadota bacterium]